MYHKDKKLYDLTRDASAPFLSFNTTQGRPDTAVMIAPKSTALIVVDMQNFFLDPRCNDHPLGVQAAERILEVVARCRVLGIQVRDHRTG